MREFTVTLRFTVDATDDERAAEIAAEVRRAVLHNQAHPYRVRDVEVDRVEEL